MCFRSFLGRMSCCGCFRFQMDILDDVLHKTRNLLTRKKEVVEKVERCAHCPLDAHSPASPRLPQLEEKVTPECDFPN